VTSYRAARADKEHGTLSAMIALILAKAVAKE
jgi:hypothetical protein